MKAHGRARPSKPAKASRRSEDGELRQAPWRTLISSVHPNPTVKINHGATFLVTDQEGRVPLEAGECPRRSGRGACQARAAPRGPEHNLGSTESPRRPLPT